MVGKNRVRLLPLGAVVSLGIAVNGFISHSTWACKTFRCGSERRTRVFLEKKDNFEEDEEVEPTFNQESFDYIYKSQKRPNEEEEEEYDEYEDGNSRGDDNTYQFKLPQSVDGSSSGVESMSKAAKERYDGAILRNVFAESTMVKNTSPYAASSASSSSSTPLMELSLLGLGTVQTRRTTAKNNKDNSQESSMPCIFLATRQDCLRASREYAQQQTQTPNNPPPKPKSIFATKKKQTSIDAMAIPLSQQRYNTFLPLLRVSYENQPISKSRCLSLNSILVNNDGGIFDTLPWKTWSVTNPNSNQNRDVAGRLVDPTYRFGKRDAYDRFLGKDWPGRSFSVGNLALKAVYLLDNLEKEGELARQEKQNRLRQQDVSNAKDGMKSKEKPEKTTGESSGVPTTKTKSSTPPAVTASTVQPGVVYEEEPPTEWFGEDFTSQDNIETTTTTTTTNKQDEQEPVKFDDAAASALAKRVLEMELRESKSHLAELEQQDAIRRASSSSPTSSSSAASTIKEDFEEKMEECRQRIQKAQDALQVLQASSTQDDSSNSKQDAPESGGGFSFGTTRNEATASSTKTATTPSSSTTNDSPPSSSTTSPFSKLKSTLRDIAQRSQTTFGNLNNTAPYRGAYGYAPKLDNASEMLDKIYPYTGPFDLLMELIENQLRADLVGTALENTSLFDGTVTLGGACVVRRKAPPKGAAGQMTLSGFGEVEVDVPVEEEAPEEIQTGDVQVAECDAEELIALALCAGKEVVLEKELWEGTKMSVVVGEKVDQGVDLQEDTVSFLGLPKIVPAGGQVIVTSTTTEVAEGTGLEAQEQQQDEKQESRRRRKRSSYRYGIEQEQEEEEEAEKERSNAPQGAKTTASFLSTDQSSSSSKKNSIVGAISSLEDFDALTVQDKARLLLANYNSIRGESMKLPRPRILNRGGGSSEPLDKLLVPLMDEAVRRQLLIRRAEQIGDYETAQRLKQQKSKRQVAKEKAEEAREEGEDEMAAFYEDEARYEESLRADVTQDEGAYNRFLDKDDWYERQRLKNVEKLKKRMKEKGGGFGTLLDGIE